MAKTKQIATDTIHSGFDAFVGLLYVITIGLTLKTAYFKSHLDSKSSIFWTYIILIFFAIDWLIRYRARQQLPESQTTEEQFPYFLKFLLEITIVYFFLLMSLKFIEIYSNTTEVKLYENDSYVILCYITAVFGAISGIWNFVIIKISKQVNIGHVCKFILKGELAPDLAKLFPDISSWQKEYKDEIQKVEVDLGKQEAIFKNGKSGEEQRNNFYKAIKTGRIKSKLVFLNSLRRKPHHILIPYLFFYHVFALNLILGIFIYLASFLGNGDALLHIPYYSLWICSGVTSLCGLGFIAYHVKEGNGASMSERIGCYLIMITFPLFYASVSTFCLIILLFIQQISANIFMTMYFEPNEEQNSTRKAV